MIFSYADLAWIKVALFLLPLSWFGFVVVRRCLKTHRFELLAPLGFLFGISSYIFFLNLFSFIIRPPLSIPATYLLLVLAALFISRTVKASIIDFPKGRDMILVLSSLLLWSVILFLLIGKKVIFGGDVHLYYAIAKTFTTGNFPMVSPWQPDLSVGYHYGGAIFIGAVNWFTDLPFDFIHRILAFTVLSAVVYTLLFFTKRHTSIFSLLVHTLVPITFVFITGIFMLVLPIFPLSLPQFSGVHELLAWLSQLPSVHISFETWGAPVTVGLIVYFLHQFISLSQFVLLLTLVVLGKAKGGLFSYLVISITLLSLAIANEAVFLPGFFMVFLGVLVKEITNKTLRSNLLKLALISAISGVILVFQGGIITEVLLGKDAHLEKSISFYLPWSQIPTTLAGYHSNQQNSKLFPPLEVWRPLRYFHVGSVLMYIVVSAAIVWSVVKRGKNKLIYFLLLVAAFSATLSYNYIVPRFKPADGNRSMILAYQFLGLIFSFFVVRVLEHSWSTSKFKFLVVGIFTTWVFGFSFLQPFAELRLQKSQTNQLKPTAGDNQPIFDWIGKNTPAGSRFLVIDAQIPNSQKTSDLLEKAGVLAPTFSSEYRAYTLETDPEYVDLVYTLNPSLVNKFGINYLLIDREGYKNLSEKRKEDLANPSYFTLVYEEGGGLEEHVYRVEDKYINEGQDLDGTFDELLALVPVGSSVYIDTWEHESPWDQLRKSVIFSFKDRNPVFVWGPGVYLNVLADISGRPPGENENYDFLVLFRSTDSASVCNCRTSLVWEGVGNNIKLWKVEK